MDTRIEVDPSMLENSDLEDYSSYESSGYNSSTASLSSSVHEYVYENGLWWLCRMLLLVVLTLGKGDATTTTMELTRT